jgi:hypothetical protein
VEVPRFAPKGLSLSLKSVNKPRNRVQRTISATLQRPARVTAAQGCSSGTVTFIVERAGRIISDSQVRLKGSCEVTKRITTKRGGSFSVTARFGGNAVLLPISQRRRFS